MNYEKNIKIRADAICISAETFTTTFSFDLYFYNELFDLYKSYKVRKYIKYFAKIYVLKQNLQ